MIKLTHQEEKTLLQIEETYYLHPALNYINSITSNKRNKKVIWRELFNQLYEILTSTKAQVDLLLEKRRNEGHIKDISQARKSIAGNAFSSLLVYIFLRNKECGNIKEHIFITSKPSEVKDFQKFTSIIVGNETQKPDVDLIIYSKNQNEVIENIIILSLKTSLRERAGQTYKWKLLMEIASSDNPIKEKYNISYQNEIIPLVCFATVNFYNEINNPQHRGMFKFFDNSFIGKPIDSDFINSLSKLIDYVNENL